jgi:primosomal protein N' (replication factor Y) (superfamily II helicase)
VGGDLARRRPEAGARALSGPPRTPDAGVGVAPVDGEPRRVVRVVPDVPAIHRRFDYAVPTALTDAVTVGDRVRVPLHGRRVGAWVVEDDVTSDPGVRPLDIAASSGLGPPPAVVDLADWAAWRWAGPMASFLGTASPPRNVRALPPAGIDGRPPSPGGGSVALVDAALATPGTSVVRLAPALDAALLVLELVHRVGADGMLVLAPARSRADHLAARLAAAGVPVALLPDEWAAARAGGRVVVGTRAGAWAPVGRLRAAVVLDAHDEAFREERAPTWSAVDVVAERGRRDGAPVLLVSPCPPLVVTSGRPLVTTDRAVERRGWPVVEIADRTGDDPRTGLFGERMASLAHAELDRPDGRVVCVLHRTGRVRVLACAACGTVARCTVCGGAVAQAEAAGTLACGRCGETRPAVCAVCDSAKLKALRIGVSRATEEVGALLATPAVEVTAAAGPAPADDFGTTRLVVGTEAALHRVDHAGLVVFLDMDHHLLALRFGAAEEALALLARAARLVGARGGTGRVLVQTRIPGHEALAAAVRADPALLAAAEEPVRRQLGLPPFGALALLRGPGAPAFADGLAAAAGLEVSALEPERFLVRADDHGALCDGLAGVARPPGRLRVEVDPTDA